MIYEADEPSSTCRFWRTYRVETSDIGYALAASSCEGANSVEACTVTALDAITAFAVPNPNDPSQSCRFFQVWLLFGLPRRADHSAYFGLAEFYFCESSLSVAHRRHARH